MSVTEIGLLHGRFVRLSDRFKAIWTYHQFAAGVFKNFLEIPLPYQIDPLTQALEALWRKGITVVVPAGNDGPAGPDYGVPAPGSGRANGVPWSRCGPVGGEALTAPAGISGPSQMPAVAC